VFVDTVGIKYADLKNSVRENGRIKYGLQKVHVMQWITFGEVHVKRSVILIDRLVPVILSAL